MHQKNKHLTNIDLKTMKFINIKLLYIWIFILTPLLFACSQTSELSEEDKKLINELGFDTELIAKIRKITDSSFVRTTGNKDSQWNFKDSLNYLEFQKKGLVGLQVSEKQGKSSIIVKSLRDEFFSKGYLIYISEFNYGYSPDAITILKTKDKFDILRFEGTNGINYGIYTEDIIEKLLVWDKNYGLKMIAAGFDLVQADYKKLPDNIDRYAKDLYEFCPDIVEQGVGSVDALKTEVIRTRELYLWWD
jgi:hypothetical protein